MNIFQRVNEVRKKIKYLQKDTQVGSGGYGYKAVTHDHVTSMVRDQLVENGVVIIPSLLESEMIQAGATKNGTLTFRYQAKFNVMFQNIDEISDSFAIVVEAHGMDNADKAPGKALSMATKYAILKVFAIETGENEESVHEGVKKEMYANEDLVAEIQQEYELKNAERLFALREANLANNVWTIAAHEARLKYKPYNSFVKGLESMLSSIEDEIIRWEISLKDAIKADDTHLVFEIWDDLSRLQKSALWRSLNEVERAAVKQAIGGNMK